MLFRSLSFAFLISRTAVHHHRPGHGYHSMLACHAAQHRRSSRARLRYNLVCSSAPSSHRVLSANPFSFELFASGLSICSRTSRASFTYCDSAMGSPQPVARVHSTLSLASPHPISILADPSHFECGLILPCDLSSTARAYGHKPGRANLLLTSIPLPSPRPHDTHTSIVRVQHTYRL